MMWQRQVAAICAATFISVGIAAQTDSTLTISESIIRDGGNARMLVGRLGQWNWSLENTGNIPSVLNSGDLMNFFRYLPSVQTASSLNGGINIDGCESSQILISLDGIPVYNSGHLLGLYSTFNSYHFSSASLSFNSPPSDSPHLGGTLSIRSSIEWPDSLSASVSIGLLFSNATLRAPVGKKCWLNFSARASYLNAFYDNLLRKNDLEDFQYSFYDINMDFNIDISDRDHLKFVIFKGNDKAGIGSDEYDVKTKMRWGNTLAGLNYRHECKKGSMEQDIYFTGYGNNVSAYQGDTFGCFTGKIADVGYKVARNTLWNGWYIKYGGGAIFHSTTPLQAEFSPDYPVSSSTDSGQKSSEIYLFANAGKYLGRSVLLEGGVKPSTFFCGRSFVGIDPNVSLSWFIPRGPEIKYSCGFNHQYIHKLSLSEISLPVDSWLASTDDIAPQKSIDGSISILKDFLNGGLGLSARLFGRYLVNQTENGQQIWDILSEGPHQREKLLTGDGYSYGAGFSIQKKTGHFTGLLSYTWGHSKRRFDKYGNTYFPASHEREHDLKMVADYKITKAFSMSTSFVYASGTPYTSPDYFYFLGGRIVCQYGSYNNARLPEFKRLDLSAEYRLPIRTVDSGVVFTAYNVLCFKNVFMYKFSASKERVSLSPKSFSVCLPVLNFYVRF